MRTDPVRHMLCQFAALHLLLGAGAFGAEKQDFLAGYKGVSYGDRPLLLRRAESPGQGHVR